MMFRKVDQAAQEFATRVSRRGFFGGLTRTALTTALAVGGFLALQSQATAETGQICCYDGDLGGCRLRKGEKTCPPGFQEVSCRIPFRGNKRWCDEVV